jgi:hypothetical protein
MEGAGGEEDMCVHYHVRDIVVVLAYDYDCDHVLD